MTASFLWYDLETFGRDPRRTRIAQFAAIRTDAELRQIGEPISIFCRPADDLLPSPEAVLITGIAPQQAERDGLPEAEFFAQLQEELTVSDTCAVGYNSLRFDDEFLRFGLYRNFHDPYEREWRNGNSRWDLLDVMRLAEALRPDGIQWPTHEDGAPSFKLEQLAEANGVREGQAHEALSDVRALIGMARLFRTAQPRLWDYALKARDKRHATQLLDPLAMRPVLHVSGRYPASRHCSALVLPLARHPKIDSRSIVFDLDADPTELLELEAADIAGRIYTPTADLPEGVARIPLKEVHANRCPILIPLEHLRGADYDRLGIDRERCEAHAERLRAAPALAEKVRRVFAKEAARAPTDADAALYDGFVPDADRRLFAKVRSATPSALASIAKDFADPRYPELLFRYRARNYPDSLDADERWRWNDYRRKRLSEGSELSELGFTSYYERIATLRATHAEGPPQALLDSLEAWGRRIEETL
ncbi:exodeoxyribonuclease I [Arenimonas sp.]|uniref:exodeoxyribonuclease I n=1 Tax=Arenimonas sp. TaxID=1872635 RepID=UPI0039E609BC